MTVLNEARSLPDFLATLAAQTLAPDEIVVVDGGSTDGTAELLRAWAEVAPGRRRVKVAPGANIATGRNLAFSMVTADVVAVTDAGTRLHVRWLEHLVTTWDRTRADVVAGFFVPSGDAFFERVLAAVITPQIGEIDPAVFQPSSRSVLMTPAAWSSVGGYPEWLDYCEDLLLDLRLRASGASFEFCPDALVTWSARSSMRGFFVQYYRYARGDGKAGIKGRQHAVRFGVYGVGLVALGASFQQPWLLAALGLAGVGYLAPSVGRLVRARTVGGRDLVRGALLVPVITVVGDVARMCGYPVGRSWRRRRSAEEFAPRLRGANDVPDVVG